ncbi:uncharacterized protein LOC133805758 [Humulus lupulus]|uniref:uncharacterized protein LOC133805758 n=1 Tax=Humulus lupulus TaxID=3486 RepID=UPI002B400583|nr:uncharacterized protein LOC133805758 [Humulus lupulus]
MFAIKTRVEEEMLEHSRHAESPKEAWDTFVTLFSNKNDARLQLLENELLAVSQQEMTINQYFNKVKSLCREILDLEPSSKIPQVRMKRIIIHGLRPEYRSFVTAIKDWPTQPSLVEFENLLADQESLAKKILGVSLKSEEDQALFSNKRQGRLRQHNNIGSNEKSRKQQKQSFQSGEAQENLDKSSWTSKQRNFRCYNCYRKGHIANHCYSKNHVEGNPATSKKTINTEEEWDFEASFAVAKSEKKDASSEELALAAVIPEQIKYKRDWIIHFRCSNHMTGDKEKL